MSQTSHTWLSLCFLGGSSSGKPAAQSGGHTHESLCKSCMASASSTEGAAGTVH